MDQAAHWPSAHCAVSWRALGCIVASSPAVSRMCPAVSLFARVHWRAVSRAVCAQCRVVSQPFRPYCTPPTPYRGACSTISQRYCALCRSLSRDTPISQAAPPITIRSFVSRKTPNDQAMRASAARPERRPAVSQRPAACQPGHVAPPIVRPGLPPQLCVTVQFPIS